MKKLGYVLLLLLLSMSVMAQNTRKENESIIRALRTSSNEAIAKQDVEGIAAYWLPDFVQVRGNGSHLVGKDTIVSLWRKSFKENPKVSYIRNPAEVIISNTDSFSQANESVLLMITSATPIH